MKEAVQILSKNINKIIKINMESCKIKWPKKMTHIENSDIMLSDQTKHRKE